MISVGKAQATVCRAGGKETAELDLDNGAGLAAASLQAGRQLAGESRAVPRPVLARAVSLAVDGDCGGLAAAFACCQARGRVGVAQGDEALRSGHVLETAGEVNGIVTGRLMIPLLLLLLAQVHRRDPASGHVGHVAVDATLLIPSYRLRRGERPVEWGV